MPETMKLLGSTKSKITKDKNGENMPHLEIPEVALVHCNTVNNNYLQDSRVNFSTAIWLPNGQLWAIIKGTASLTRC